MEKNFPFEVRAKFIRDALRQLNYTNYTAIADIVDNSLEPDVESENIYIKLVKAEDKKTVGQIVISDDGCGMDEETLCMAMSLGSETGKNKDFSLGCYGAGLKTASISIGTRLSVYSKTENGELFVATLDLDDITNDGKLNVRLESYAEGTKEAIEQAKADLQSGKIQVFDTAAFTVDGKKLESYMADVDTDANYEGDHEAIVDGHFAESAEGLRSAPYFNLNIDGITLLDQKF